MAISVVVPYENFHDLKGNPLDTGYIYIGSAGLNPEVYPISVFWDSDFDIPASQPIRTIAGHPSRSGSPATIYVSGDYSITVRDKNKKLIYSRLSGNAIDANGILGVTKVDSIASLREVNVSLFNAGATAYVDSYYVSTIPDGGGGEFYFVSGAAPGTYIDNGGTIIVPTGGDGSAAWLRTGVSSLDVRWFGAKEGGLVDATEFFQAAHDSLPSNGGEVFFDGTYLLNQTATANQFTIWKSNVTFRGNGWASVLKHTATGVVSGNNAVVMVRPLSGDISNIILKDFRILGPTTNTGAAIFGDSRVLGLAINDGSETPHGTITDVLVENVLIEGMETACFALNGAGDGSTGCERIKFSKCWARNSRQDGFNDFGGAFNYDITLDNCYATDLDGFGMEMSSAGGLTINGGIIARTGQSAIGITYHSVTSLLSEVLVNSVYIHDIGTTAYPNSAGITLGQVVSQTNTTVSGCVIKRTGGYGAEVVGVADNITFNGNTIHDVGGNGVETVGISFQGNTTNSTVLANVINTSTAGYTMTKGIAIAGTGSATNLVKDNHVLGWTVQPLSANPPTRIVEGRSSVGVFSATGNVGVGEDDLNTSTIAANTLHLDEMGIHIVAFGTTAANANNKRVKLYFSAAVLLDTTAIAASNKDWRIEAYVWRSSSSTIRFLAWGDFNGAVIQTNYGIAGGRDFTIANVVKCTGEATADNDIVQNGLVINYLERPQ